MLFVWNFFLIFLFVIFTATSFYLIGSLLRRLSVWMGGHDLW